MADMSGVDCAAGQCFIPASQRPDGTWRKARRVKDGYIPQEEMPLYESKGKQWAKSRPDHPIGLAPDDVAAAKARKQASTDMGIPGLAVTTKSGGMSKSQKKKAAKKKAAAAAADTEINKMLEDTHVSNNTNADAKQPVATDSTKRLRNLKKKLRDIEKLETQIKSGELKKPGKDQLEKIKRKSDVMQQIEELEEELEEGN
ncbi:hypothetical protein Pmani_035900 [Petrolisthes manimaculis]|uniref:Partner of Y14 and mago n=1 Tax=Petrolisthes manimaculis TaxID=1843537 RepID=A0AAE1TQ00_9EUCA|nr:hypothetical protein Pmani_035900 [Petrolisthes manimaculis]